MTKLKSSLKIGDLDVKVKETDKGENVCNHDISTP